MRAQDRRRRRGVCEVCEVCEVNNNVRYRRRLQQLQGTMCLTRIRHTHARMLSCTICLVAEVLALHATHTLSSSLALALWRRDRPSWLLLAAFSAVHSLYSGGGDTGRAGCWQRLQPFLDPPFDTRCKCPHGRLTSNCVHCWMWRTSALKNPDFEFLCTPCTTSSVGGIYMC